MTIWNLEHPSPQIHKQFSRRRAAAREAHFEFQSVGAVASDMSVGQLVAFEPIPVASTALTGGLEYSARALLFSG